MDAQDLVLVIVLGAAAVGIAFVLGRRRREASRLAAAQAAEQAKKAAAPAKDEPKAKKDEPKGAKDEPKAKDKDEPKAKDKAADEARSKKEGAPSEAKAKEPKAEPAVARLTYEEDEDIDPTRVGAAAEAPAATPAAKAPAPAEAASDAAPADGDEAASDHPIYKAPLQRVVYDEDAETDEPTRAESLFLVHATAQTDPGLRRKRNEDSLLVSESDNLFVIADGMGGYHGGDMASQIAVKTIADAFRTKNFEGPKHEGVPNDATNLGRAIQMANTAILETAKKKPQLEGMGTTVCAARFSPNKKRLFIGHVGDSRCYRLRSGVFKQMTADHTMADHGVTGPESAQLSRAVGIWPVVPIDIVMAMPEPGDAYLLCSDGLTKMLRDETIAATLRSEEDPAAAVERLVFFANAKGGKDNITVILVRVVSPDWKPAPKAEAAPS